MFAAVVERSMVINFVVHSYFLSFTDFSLCGDFKGHLAVDHRKFIIEN